MGECPRCGVCYDDGVRECSHDGAVITPLRLPRHLVNRYRLDRRLGRGGMGTVYQATDTSLERSVAVKIIRDDLLGAPDTAERFRREARATAAFSHPNVVTVHDFGVVDRTVPFLVLELLRGTSLRDDLVKHKRLDAERTRTILGSVCAALSAAHRRDLVHRDLKPENIFLSRDEGVAGEQDNDVVKVLDFGLAKFRAGAMRQESDTQPGVLVGTLAYMAPERFRGDAVHPSWDIWSLAVIAYEMLVGQRPFRAETQSGVQRALLAGHFDAVARHVTSAPPSLQAFFERSLSLHAADRPPSTREFFAQLEQALGG